MAHIQLIGIVEPKSDDGKIWRFPYAFPIIIRELLKTKHTFELLDTHLHKKTRLELFEYLTGCKAKIYGISAYSEGYAFVKKIVSIIRQANPDAIIIVGGLVAKSYHALNENSDIDIFVHSADGQFILPKILDAIDNNLALSQIKGIAYKDNGSLLVNDDLPTMSKEEYYESDMPAYEYFDAQISELVTNINSKNDVPVKGFPLLTMRGCPFQCTFCGHMYGHKFLRRKWEVFFDELQFLIDRYGIEGFYSFDTNMFLNLQDIEDYCKIYNERNMSFKMVTEVRASFGDKEIFKKLVEHGVRVSTFGWESGSQKILDIMKKNIKVEKILHTTRQAAEGGMIVYGNFLFGMPGENKNTVKETMFFMMELEKLFIWQRKYFKEHGIPYKCTSNYNYSILIPLPTSEVFDKAVQNGLIGDMDTYLSYLDTEEGDSDYLKSHVRYLGGAVNLSEFSSKQALIHYVALSMSKVKILALILDDGVGFTLKGKLLLGLLGKFVKNYALYLFTELLFMVEQKKSEKSEMKKVLALSLMRKQNRDRYDDLALSESK